MIDWLKNLLNFKSRKPDTSKTRSEAARENVQNAADDFNQETILMLTRAKRTRTRTRSEVFRPLPRSGA